MASPLRFLVIFTVLAALVLPARAQSANPAIWCPPGAAWTYPYALFSERGTVTVSYTGNAVMAGQPVQVLARTLNTVVYGGPNPTPSTRSLPPVYTRVVGDRVEVLAYGQFYTLYDFGAPVGSTWQTPLVVPYGPCPQASGLGTVRVDSVGTQRIGGRTFRWFRPHLMAPAGAPYQGYWPGRIYEQLGSVGAYMQPQSPICAGTDPGYMGALSEYRATGQSTIAVQSGTIVLATAESRASAAGFTAYPSPGAGLLTLELPAAVSPRSQLRLLDLSGRELRRLPVARQIDLGGLPAGTYTLLLEQPGQAVLVRRVVRD